MDVDVELREVSKHFGAIVAVDRVSLAIRRGEFFSLLGPSGCGKTTTLRMIGGLEFPTAGEILLRGAVVTDLPAYRRATNMVFQHLALFPHLTVFENIAFGLRLRREPPSVIARKVDGVLQLVDLPGYGGREIHQLSGGQKQRVAIARALVNEPAVLLLDEPLGSLDLKLRLAMQTELKALQHRVGTTFIYVTHDQGEALTMSDRIAVMNLGRVEQVATSQEIYARPRTRFVAGFIGEANFLDGRVAHAGPDGVLVAVNGLRVRAEAAPAPAGAAVTVSVRPEHVKLGVAADGAANRWTGRIEEVTFMGAVVRARVALDGGPRLVAELHNDAAAGLAPGAAVAVGWAAGHTVVLAG
ncbi:MAG: ABC transporter ATP-binding protein [Armatimonadota bacterium]|nr:ABC transporter ATP-binding protein [Armatimonadota bacterium]MDR7421399.1 ABC transporter ATP-binding protein [Armatimonadota bacterium]MDR7454317.1 ABC transporter ATP-binding protein [Armatimonadota bacterium]MDR7456663.1 ABC transporter ATP-binding protein [Armatimonadota bacterium]